MSTLSLRSIIYSTWKEHGSRPIRSIRSYERAQVCTQPGRLCSVALPFPLPLRDVGHAPLVARRRTGKTDRDAPGTWRATGFSFQLPIDEASVEFFLGQHGYPALFGYFAPLFHSQKCKATCPRTHTSTPHATPTSLSSRYVAGPHRIIQYQMP